MSQRYIVCFERWRANRSRTIGRAVNVIADLKLVHHGKESVIVGKIERLGYVGGGGIMHVLVM